MVIVTPRFAEKHDYKYNITDKYGVDPTDMEHLVLPAAPGLGKNPGAEHYGAGGVAEGMAGAGAGEDKYDKYQAPDMSHLHPNLDHLHSRYSLSEVQQRTIAEVSQSRRRSLLGRELGRGHEYLTC